MTESDSPDAASAPYHGPSVPAHLRLTANPIGFSTAAPRLRFAPGPNWVDDGALSLGICSYALIDGSDAIVYDTQVSVEHAFAIRRELERLGVTHIVVVLSHWHLDHVAGTEAFGDCEIVASRPTADLLTSRQAAIEAGSSDHGPPAITPLVLPTTVFEGQTELAAGKLRVTAEQFDIHSRDSVVLHLPDDGVLLAGDTVEDTVTYVSEPESLENHIDELARLRRLKSTRIYPNHGSPGVLQEAGDGEGLIRATQSYIRDLLSVPRDPAVVGLDLRSFVADSLDAGWITYYEPYERVHQSNGRSVAHGTLMVRLPEEDYVRRVRRMAASNWRRPRDPVAPPRRT